MQTSEIKQYFLRDVAAFGHTFKPAETTIRRLEFKEFIQVFFRFIFLIIQVEKQGNLSFLLRFILCFGHPGRFFEHHVFQFLIFLQVRKQCITCSAGFFPAFKGCCQLRTGIGNVSRQRIGIISRKVINGIFMRWFGQCGQSLNSVPGRIGRKFHGKILCIRIFQLTDKTIETKCAGLISPDGQRLTFGDQHLIGQNGQVFLFAVGEITGLCGYFTNHQIVIFQFTELPFHHFGGFRFDCKRLRFG